MKTKLFSKLSNRIIFSFVVLTILVSIITTWNMSTSLYNEYVNKGTSIAEAIAEIAIGGLTQVDGSQLQTVINEYQTSPAISYVYVADENNQPLIHSFNGTMPTIETTYEINETTRFNEQFYSVEVQAPILYGTLGTVHIGMKLAPITGIILPAIGKIVAIMAGMLLLTLLIIQKVTKGFSQPIKQIISFSKDCQNYQFNLSQVDTEAIEKLAERDDEISSLANTNLDLYKQLEQYINTIAETTSKQTEINKELSIAKDIQASLIPNLNNLSIETLSINGFIEQGKTIGCDFYDVIEKNNKTFIIIGDVAGKGLPAALLMNTTINSLRSGISYLDNPTEIIGNLNQQLCINNTTNTFVTLFMGIIDSENGTIEYINAGHPSAIIKSDTIAPLESTNGIACGINEHAFYISKKATLPKGCSITFFTNGLIDITNKRNETFQQAGLINALSIETDDQINLSDSIKATMTAFKTSQPVEDDIACLTVTYTPVSIPLPNPLTISFKNDINELTKLQDITEQFSDEYNINRKVEKSLNLILEELISNIMFYGYKGAETATSEREIQVKFSHSEDSITVNIEDDGTEFNPLTDAPQDDTFTDLDNRPIGGLGIKIIKKMASSIDYERNSEKNKVTITKELA